MVAASGELQRGVPGCPPATLAKRLRRLTSAGVVERVRSADGHRYELTEAGRELYPLVEGLGVWGQRWARSTYEPDELHADVLLWDLRRFLDPSGLGIDRSVIELRIRQPGTHDQLFWLVVEPGAVDLCLTPIERPVDVVLDTQLLALTRIWMGDDSWAAAESRRELRVSGPTRLAARLPDWIGRHPVLAAVPRGPHE